MKKSLLLVCMTLLSYACFARPIDNGTARKIASSFLSASRRENVKVADVSMATDVNNVKGTGGFSDVNKPYYIFNAVDGRGFVIVGGDNSLSPIIGYSTESDFDTDESLPPALEWYLDYVDKYVSAVQKGEILPVVQSHIPRKLDVVVQPLCRSTWGQGTPYNNLCPNKMPVGCVATAMAQLMYYWKWPETGTGSMSYMTKVGKIKVNFADSHYDWGNMQNSGNTSMVNADAVAKLCFDCGVSLEMMYDDDGSGTYQEYAYRSFVKNFGYAASKLDIEYRDCVDDETWNRYVKEELDASRPIFYRAADANGNGGHAFIIDGYDEDFNVHVNWGWDGRDNGYFQLATLAIGKYYEFSQGQVMFRGLVPDYDGTDSKQKQLFVYMYESPEVAETNIALTDSFTVVGRDFYNQTLSKSFNVMIGLCGMDGQLIDTLETYIDDADFMRTYGYRIGSCDFRVILPKSLSDGYYQIRLFFQEKKAKEWILPKVVLGKEDAVYFLKEGNNIIFNRRPVGIERVIPQINDRNGTIYNIKGEKISVPQKGYNIINGKKYLYW